MTTENTLLAPQAGSKRGAMTLPAGFPYALNQEVEIPLDQMIPNPQQPRRSSTYEKNQI